MPHHPLANFEIQKYYQKEPTFNGVYSRNNLRKIKDGEIQLGACAINFDEYESIESHWIALYLNTSDNVTYLDSFEVEHISKVI